MGGEGGIEADGEFRRVLDGDSDCGSVYVSITGRDGENAAVEGEKAQPAVTQTQTPRKELLQADAQNSRGKRVTQSFGGGATAYHRRSAGREGSIGKRLTQSLGGGATAYDRRSAGREGSARGSSPAAVADIVSTMFADTVELTSSPRLNVSVRAKIEMFERTTRSWVSEETKLKTSMGRLPRPRRLSRSLSEIVRAHEIAISAATTPNGTPNGTPKGLPFAFPPGHLSRSQSYQPVVRTSPSPTAMAATDEHVTDNTA